MSSSLSLLFLNFIISNNILLLSLQPRTDPSFHYENNYFYPPQG